MRESLVGAALAVVTGEAGQRLMGVAADAPTPIHTLLAAAHNRLRSGCSGPREGWAVGPSLTRHRRLAAPAFVDVAVAASPTGSLYPRNTQSAGCGRSGLYQRRLP
jgi:hypothetical protein